MLTKAGVITFALVGLTSMGEAQVLSNPTLKSAVGSKHVGVSYAVSNLDYEAENFGEVEVERGVIGIEVSSGINKRIDGFVQLGIIGSGNASLQRDAATEKLSQNRGLMIGVGARGTAYQDSNGFVSAYGLLNYTTEGFSGKLKGQEQSSEVKTEITDIHLGSVYNLNYAPDVTPYSGLELIFASEGKLKSSGELGRQSRDFERENKLAVKFGANIDLDKSVVRPEVILLGERTISISATMLY